MREGGSGDGNINPILRNALAAAKSDNVPVDNIDRAIERALGGGEGNAYDAVTYEGYGPSGVALVVEALTDNRNRTASEVRHVFAKLGGNMSGSTAWQFDTKGMIVVENATESMQELAIELGADDLEVEDTSLTIYTAPNALYSVVEGLQSRKINPVVNQFTKLAQTETIVSSEDATKVARMIEALEELDDVQSVYSTANLENLEIVS